MVARTGGAGLIPTFKLVAGPVQVPITAAAETRPFIVPTVALIDVELELPVQSPGNVQTYSLAPETGEIL